jgi:hypothetical protein
MEFFLKNEDTTVYLHVADHLLGDRLNVWLNKLLAEFQEVMEKGKLKQNMKVHKEYCNPAILDRMVK